MASNTCSFKMFKYKIMILISLFAILYWKTVLSMQVIPERAMITYSNDKYTYSNATLNVRRTGRRSPYFINLETTLKTQFGNNVSLSLIFFELLHNEYKRSFVEMKFNKLCDAINDRYIGGAFKMIGLICPLTPGHYKLMNLTVPAEDFPNVFPFERGKIEVTLAQNKNGDLISIAEVFVTFKQKLYT